MKFNWSSFTLILAISCLSGLSFFYLSNKNTGAPDVEVSKEAEVPQTLDHYSWLSNWQRPPGPARVGIQVGHWQNQDAPEEQINLRKNNGASSSGVNEVDINLDIALKLKALLEEKSIVVDLLPTTIPPAYWADVFIAIHADGNLDSSVNGYKFAGPWRDYSGKSTELISLIEPLYKELTKLNKDPNISRNMRGYYAFSWWRYKHAIHPKTVAIIAETGFVSSPQDRSVLTKSSHLPAKTLAEGIIQFLQIEKLL